MKPQQQRYSRPIPGASGRFGGDDAETHDGGKESSPTGQSGHIRTDAETPDWELPNDPESWGPPPADDWEIPEWEPFDWEPIEWEP